jgi:hypothetical protein
VFIGDLSIDMEANMLQLLKTTPGIISLVGVVLLIILPFVVGVGVTDVTTVMRVLISLIVLGSGMYVILSDKYPADTQKWAFGIVGLIVGYWLPAV